MFTAKNLLILLASICLAYCQGSDEDMLVTLPYGDDIGDYFGPYGQDVVSPSILLLGKYMFYGHEENTLHISENGVISFGSPFPDPFPKPLPFSTDPNTSTPAFIAGFWGDINVRKNGGAIFYRELDASIGERFCTSRARVVKMLREGFGGSMEGFNPTHIFLVTWEAVHDNNQAVKKAAVTYQIVLATDSKKTYTLLLYSDVRWNSSNGHGVLVGFNAGDGVRSFTHPLSTEGRILELDSSTNTGRTGSYAYRVDLNKVEEPTDAQVKEELCILRVACGGSAEEGEMETCSCPSEDRPRLAFNQINCIPAPLTVELFNNTPAVSKDNVVAHIRSNRRDASLSCQLLRFDSGKEDCSLGMFHRSSLPPNTYTLRVVATTTETNERVILRSYFTVVPEKTTSTDRDMCAVTIINNGSEVKNGTVNVEFTGTEAVTSFQCRMDRKRHVPCESPLRMENLAPGPHRVVVIPKGCGRNRKTGSVRFTVE